LSLDFGYFVITMPFCIDFQNILHVTTGI